MSIDKTTNPLNLLPSGWQIDVSFVLDGWPCVLVKLTQDSGKVSRKGHGDAETFDAALKHAVDEVLLRVNEGVGA